MDDGSTDGSGEILDEYREKVEKSGGGGQRIVVIHQKNAGVSAARNSALDIATGDWIWLIGGDDIIHRSSLSNIHAVLSYSVDVVGVHIGRIEATERPKIWDIGQLNVKVSDTFHSSAMIMFMHAAWNFVIKWQFIGETRFRLFPRNEDMVFMMELMWRSGKWIFLDGPFYFWRQRDGSAVHCFQPTRKQISEIFFY